MRYVLFNWLSPEDLADWETWTPEQQQADAERHMAWFGKHRDHIVGGEGGRRRAGQAPPAVIVAPR